MFLTSWLAQNGELSASQYSELLGRCDVHHNLAGHSLMSHWRGDPVISSGPGFGAARLMRDWRRTTVQLPTDKSFITRRSGHIVQRRPVETLLGLKLSKRGGRIITGQLAMFDSSTYGLDRSAVRCCSVVKFLKLSGRREVADAPQSSQLPMSPCHGNPVGSSIAAWWREPRGLKLATPKGVRDATRASQS